MARTAAGDHAYQQAQVALQAVTPLARGCRTRWANTAIKHVSVRFRSGGSDRPISDSLLASGLGLAAKMPSPHGAVGSGAERPLTATAPERPTAVSTATAISGNQRDARYPHDPFAPVWTVNSHPSPSRRGFIDCISQNRQGPDRGNSCPSSKKKSFISF